MLECVENGEKKSSVPQSLYPSPLGHLIVKSNGQTDEQINKTNKKRLESIERNLPGIEYRQLRSQSQLCKYILAKNYASLKSKRDRQT